MRQPEKFTPAIPQAQLDDLRERLARTRWSAAPAGAGWEYGMDDTVLRDLVAYWNDEFDWRAVEERINAFDHFRVEMEPGVPIHFIHARGRGKRVVPLVCTHGWPWTFWDWHALIGPLSRPADHGLDDSIAFDVVVPSLPGYGFSAPLSACGITAPKVADLWDRLMREVLGYGAYCAAGGDWGAFVTWELGTRHVPACQGIYLSFPPIWHAGGVEGLAALDYADDEAGWREQTMARWETAISHLTVHSRDHMTLAYALNDSPVGLAAWLIERRRNWSDCGGEVLSAFDREFLITTVMIYWLTGTIGSSMQLYAEQFRAASLSATNYTAADLPRIEAPTAIGVYPGELVRMPRAACAGVANLKDWAVLPKGGHFAPSEVPATYVAELRRTFAGPLSCED